MTDKKQYWTDDLPYVVMLQSPFGNPPHVTPIAAFKDASRAAFYIGEMDQANRRLCWVEYKGHEVPEMFYLTADTPRTKLGGYYSHTQALLTMLSPEKRKEVEDQDRTFLYTGRDPSLDTNRDS